MITRGITPTKREMEDKIAKVGDYVKMDYLQACLKQNLDFDTRKFALVKLAGIYEPRGMFGDAAKLMNASAEINTTFDGKMKDFMKAAELFIKAGLFDESDVAFGKALACVNEKQKADLKVKRKDMYKVHAKELLKRDKRRNAMEAYEKLASLDLDAQEKNEVQTNLMQLYEKLGRVRDFYTLKRTGS
jgi:tetratricopeptide (TPR) repeat protein